MGSGTAAKASCSSAEAIGHCPLIAILRGLRPAETSEIGAALVEAGVRVIEVPLNSPDSFTSIRILSEQLGTRAVIGVGSELFRTGDGAHIVASRAAALAAALPGPVAQEARRQ